MKYNICMFAYNEEANIEKSIRSVFENSDQCLDTFFILANGCTDKTVSVANEIKNKLNFSKLQIVEIAIGDKCNAWNTYMHTFAAEQDVHFFVDADVQFTSQSFRKLADKLNSQDDTYVAVAGLPQSGRNMDFYASLVKERACIFGNLYGFRLSFIKRIQETEFKLPRGLCWIDSFITKALNTDLKFFNYNLPNRVCYVDGVGYTFSSLSFWKLKDVELYLKRIGRYEHGKIQEIYLDSINVSEWPKDMAEINADIRKNFDEKCQHLSVLKKYLVRRRIFK